MNITIRKSVKLELVQSLPEYIEEAKQWLKNKYPNVNFENVEYIFSAGYNRSRYFRNDNTVGNFNIKYSSPVVCICTRSTLMLYEKRSLGLIRFNIRAGYENQIICALIHELTHHVQYELKEREGNELDTTANELEWLKENAIQVYNKLIK